MRAIVFELQYAYAIAKATHLNKKKQNNRIMHKFQQLLYMHYY